jgi:hypothetical protein
MEYAGRGAGRGNSWVFTGVTRAPATPAQAMDWHANSYQEQDPLLLT